MSNRIAIIGAGWMGIGCLRILISRGYQVDVYEKENDIGGVWHPKNWYINLSLHGPALTVEYYDFPLPSEVDKTCSMTAEQIYFYLKSYCKFKELYKHIHLNSKITHINYDSQTKTCVIHVLNQDNLSEAISYDYVVYTHGFTDRSLPPIKGQDQFLGEIYHAFDINKKKFQSIINQNKKVTIVGASKTATDFVQAFAKNNYEILWLYRKNYWFFRETIYRKALKNILMGKKINIYLYSYKFADLLSTLIRSKSQKIYFLILKFFNLIHTYGEKHTDFRKYHGGRIEDSQMQLLTECNRKYHIEGEIDYFVEDGFLLKDGTKIETNDVIFCTGSAGCHSIIPIYIDNKILPLDKIDSLYRSRVIPVIPAIIFTAFSDFNIGTINGLIYGKWIAKYISEKLSKEYLVENATNFHKPFFATMHLFDSSEYFYTRQKYMLNDFFKNGELSKNAIKEWSWKYHFGGKSQEPYDFKKRHSA